MELIDQILSSWSRYSCMYWMKRCSSSKLSFNGDNLNVLLSVSMSSQNWPFGNGLKDSKSTETSIESTVAFVALVPNVRSFPRVYRAVAWRGVDRLCSRSWRCCVPCVCATVWQCGPIRTTSATTCCQTETCCCKPVWWIRSPGTIKHVLSPGLSSLLQSVSFFSFSVFSWIPLHLDLSLISHSLSHKNQTRKSYTNYVQNWIPLKHTAI